jgi:hypothetical protein
MQIMATSCGRPWASLFFDGLSNLLKPGNGALVVADFESDANIAAEAREWAHQKGKKPEGRTAEVYRRSIPGHQSRIVDVQRPAQQSSVGGVLLTHLVAIAYLVKWLSRTHTQCIKSFPQSHVRSTQIQGF